MKKAIKAIMSAILCFTVFCFAGCGFETPDFLKETLCDHVFDEVEILKEPTCGESGKKMKVCSDCGKTVYVNIKATGDHVFDEGVPSDGFITYTCTVCEKTKKEAYVHVHVDADGNVRCDECGEVDFEYYQDESNYTVSYITDEHACTSVAGSFLRFEIPTKGTNNDVSLYVFLTSGMMYFYWNYESNRPEFCYAMDGDDSGPRTPVTPDDIPYYVFEKGGTLYLDVYMDKDCKFNAYYEQFSSEADGMVVMTEKVGPSDWAFTDKSSIVQILERK